MKSPGTALTYPQHTDAERSPGHGSTRSDARSMERESSHRVAASESENERSTAPETVRLNVDGPLPASLTPGVILALQRTVGNRAAVGVIARQPSSGGAAPTPTSSDPNLLPRVRVEPHPRLRNRLRLRYGSKIIGTVDIRGAKVQDVRIRDRTENRPGKITALDLEVLHAPGVKVTFDLWRRSFADVRKRHGILDVQVRPIEAKPPLPKDELQLWPPLYDLGPIEQRHEPTPEEIAEWSARSRELDRLSKIRRKLERRMDDHRDEHEWVIENKKDFPIVSFFADVIGGANLPSRGIWIRPAEDLAEAQHAIERGDIEDAQAWLLKAAESEADAYAKVKRYRKDTMSGAETAVSGLEKVRDVGEVTASLIPGPVGRVLEGVYEVVKEPPKTMEEAAERLRGAHGLGGDLGGSGGKTKPPKLKPKPKPKPKPKKKPKPKGQSKKPQETGGSGGNDASAKARAEAKAKAEADARAKAEAEAEAKEKAAAEAKAKARTRRLDELSIDPQTGKANPKSRSEAESILQAEDEGLVKNARRPNLKKGEPNLDFIVDGGYAEIKTPETAHRSIAQNAKDIADKAPYYDGNVSVIVDLKKLKAPERTQFVNALSKALTAKGSSLARVSLLNQ